MNLPNAANRLRRDLVVSAQETKEGKIFVLKDRASGRFFRLREPEHFIVEQLDGATPLEVIRRRVEERFGATLAPRAIEQFVGYLQRNGLLETGESAPGRPAGERRRIRGSLLYLRFKAFDPDALLGRLVARLRFFFTRPFLWLSAAAIVSALGITVASGNEIAHDVRQLYNFHALLLAWVTLLAVVTLHEFAHGLTCKYFGGEVREMGFLLIYFQPAFYCNVSDAWLFPEKSKRLWVTFAGAYFELFLWALATWTWRITEPGTWVSFVALVVMATSAIKSFFNLNPLIKLDGYYLLSDLLEIPNLRSKAFHYLGERLRRFGRSPLERTGEATTRERRIYLVYGVLAGVYSFWLLGWVALWFGSFLTARYQGLGFLLFGILLMSMFQGFTGAAWADPARLLRSGRQKFMGLPGPWKNATIGAVLVGVLFSGRMELKVAGEFVVLPIHNADVRAEVAGIIQGIYVEEGQQVNKGDLLALLSDRDNRAEIQKVRAEVAEKEARLRMLRIGPRREEIELADKDVATAKTKRDETRRRYEEAQSMHGEFLTKARAAVKKAEERLEYARSNVGRYKTLFEEGLVSRKEADGAEEEMAVRQRELEEARAQLGMALADRLGEARKESAVAEMEAEQSQGKLRILLAGARKEEIEAARAELARLQAQRDYLQKQLELVRVVSPISGVVTTPKPKEKVGEHVSQGDLILEIHRLETVTAEIAVPEKEIADVKVGQPVVLKARAYPSQTFHGKVTSIAPAAATKDGAFQERTIVVNSELNNASGLLKSGMSGTAKVHCGRRWLPDLLTRRVSRYIRVEFWSWW